MEDKREKILSELFNTKDINSLSSDEPVLSSEKIERIKREAHNEAITQAHEELEASYKERLQPYISLTYWLAVVIYTVFVVIVTLFITKVIVTADNNKILKDYLYQQKPAWVQNNNRPLPLAPLVLPELNVTPKEKDDFTYFEE